MSTPFHISPNGIKVDPLKPLQDSQAPSPVVVPTPEATAVAKRAYNKEIAKEIIAMRAIALSWPGKAVGDLVVNTLGYHWQYEQCIMFAPADDLGEVADPSQIHEVHGDILIKYKSMGAELSGLGYPTSDETSTADNQCRFNTFQNGGAIYWTAAHGAFFVVGDIYRKWMAQGGQSSGWGYPITDESIRLMRNAVTLSSATIAASSGLLKRVPVCAMARYTRSGHRSAGCRAP